MTVYFFICLVFVSVNGGCLLQVEPLSYDYNKMINRTFKVFFFFFNSVPGSQYELNK